MAIAVEFSGAVKTGEGMGLREMVDGIGVDDGAVITEE